MSFPAQFQLAWESKRTIFQTGRRAFLGTGKKIMKSFLTVDKIAIPSSQKQIKTSEANTNTCNTIGLIVCWGFFIKI